MWKEKYEALKKELEEFRNSETVVTSTPYVGVSGAANGGEMAKWFEKFPKESLEATYQYVRKRLREEQPQELLALHERPEMQVKIQRPVVTVDGTTMQGRLCLLITEGFFKTPQSAKVTTAEAVRRGWCHPKTPFMRLADPLDKLTGMGFLTREADGYLIVPGMKIKMVEA